MVTYKESGVDLKSAEESVEIIKGLVNPKLSKSVLNGIGGFSGLFKLSKEYKEPVLVSSTDGVGTKLKIAFSMDKHDTIGIDLVAMCVNDVITTGAIPLFLLDYISTSKLCPEKIKSIISGILNGCDEAECDLIGGEIAEMPGFYKDDEYDIAGFCVGIIEKENIIKGDSIKAGDKIIGLASSGIHSNGFSLVRKVFFDKHKFDLCSYFEELGRTLGEELLIPTTIYVKLIKTLVGKYKIKGIANITGGGIEGNIVRIIPDGLKVKIFYKDNWTIPAIFNLIMKLGEVEFEEMKRTFNLGIGMALIVGENMVDDIMNFIAGAYHTIGCYLIGEVVKS